MTFPLQGSNPCCAWHEAIGMQDNGMILGIPVFLRECSLKVGSPHAHHHDVCCMLTARPRTDKDSKLCNVLFTLEAQRRLSARKSKVKVDCFSPGLIPSSGLFRYQNPIVTKIFDFAAVYFLKVSPSLLSSASTSFNRIECVTCVYQDSI